VGAGFAAFGVQPSVVTSSALIAIEPTTSVCEWRIREL
jgi:hypothetical protein